MKTVYCTCAAFLISASALLAAPADTPGTLKIDKPGAERNDGTFNIGYQFKVGPRAVQVTRLGFYAAHAALKTTHTIAVYNLDGSAVAGETGAASVSPKDAKSADGFVYVSVTPFTLKADTSYIIGGSTVKNDGDPFLGQDGKYLLAANSGIVSIDKPKYNNNGVDQPPTFDGGDGQAFVGPNLIAVLPKAK